MDSQNYSDDQDEAEEETLSFCDLPMYSDPAEWENTSREDRTLPSSSSSFLLSNSADQLDLFEFLPEEWSSTASTSSFTYPAGESIVFCGKLIHFKQPTVVVSDNDSTHQLQTRKRQKRRKIGIFRWILRLFRRRRRRAKSAAGRGGCRKKTNRRNLSSVSSPRGGKKNGFPVGRSAPVLACSPSRSRWYLLMFGLGRSPAEMELRDMRSRQRRRSEVGNDHDEKLIRAKWLWWLITALGCGCFTRRLYQQANLAVMD